MAVKSEHIFIPDPTGDLWSLIFEQENMSFSGHKPIYIDAQTKQQYTWEETKVGALKFGKGLQEVWDWEKGDVLVVFSPNCIDTPAIAFGTIWAGGIVSPANPTYTVDELGYQLKDSGAKAVATQLPLLSLVTQAAEIAGVSQDKIVLMGDCVDPRGKIRHFSSFQDSLNTRQCRRPVINPKTDLALLAYSSGTTGHPKGVKLSHRNMMMNLLQIQATEEGNLRPTGGDGGNGDIILAVVPYYHVYGVAFLVNIPAYMGLTSVVMRTYKLSSLLQVIQAFRPTYANLVPPIILHLTKSPLASNYDISSLRMVMCGAAPLTRELIDGFYMRHGIPVRQVYGLSETSPVALVQSWHTCRDSIGSVGQLVPNMTAKFCNESGEEVSAGSTGEIFLKGPNVFQGYLNNLHGSLDCLSEDGWFRTGDIGYVDANGNFYITDRVKELIKYNGFQVPPAEIEGHLLQHPQIADVAVIGVTSQQAATELPRAYVVLVPSALKSPAMERSILDWLEQRVAPHKRLRGGVEFIDEIPKSASGKILRRLLRDRAKQGAQKMKKKQWSKAITKGGIFNCLWSIIEMSCMVI